tara:strand:+ start:672 stop:1190 length:519 start_codon:yes stop_codon:yes gene_type:complete
MEKRNSITKIVFTGPECSGKTTLSNYIAKKFNLPLVPEYARNYLNDLKRDYLYSDLLEIAKGQINLEKTMSNKQKILVCDTNLQVIKIWSKIKFSKCHPFILKNQDGNAYYVLCTPDFTWQYDPLRENKNNRNMLFKEYQSELILNKQKFIIAKGSIKDRKSLIENIVLKML